MKFTNFLSIGTSALLLLVTGKISSAATPENLYKRDFTGKIGVVSAAKPEAAQVGLDILKKGGNAVDAAVATAFSIGVLEPNASGIGGGGFMIIRSADTGKITVIDFREQAPLAAKDDMYKVDEKGKVLNGKTTNGGLASAVPGSVAGLLTALEKYGTMDRKEILQPAIDYAKNGFEVTSNFETIINDNFEKLSLFPATSDIFLNEGLPFMSGDILKQTDLAKTLQIISDKGQKGFYEGEIAEKIVKGSKESGGIITKKDLKNYKVMEREPIVGTYRGYKIVSAPPASSGGTHVVQLLNLVENYDLEKLGDNSAETWHIWSEAMKRMYIDRGEYMGDTAFIDVPLKGLTSKDYAKELTTKFNLDKPSENIAPGNPEKYESGSTTHFSVMDAKGNMVAVTQTINYFFGSGVVIPGTGILMNNEMADFEAVPGKNNSIAPGKRPLSSMSPTLVLDKENRPFMAVGSPGATRIIPAIAYTISNVIDHGMTMEQAINAPRVIQLPNKNLQIEGRVSINAYDKLKKMGHIIDVKGDYDLYFGGVHGVLMNYETNSLEGSGDPRRDGVAVGY